jgi:hypothetical protein
MISMAIKPQMSTFEAVQHPRTQKATIVRHAAYATKLTTRRRPHSGGDCSWGLVIIRRKLSKNLQIMNINPVVNAALANINHPAR